MSQISNANEIMKKQSVEDIPSAVKVEELDSSAYPEDFQFVEVKDEPMEYDAEMNCSNNSPDEGDGEALSHTEKVTSNSDPWDVTFGPNLATDAIIHNEEQSHSRHSSKRKSKVKSTPRHYRAPYPRQKIFACDQCDYLADRKTNLSRHMRIHTKERPFACNICDHKAREKSHLITHMLIHTGNLPFACNICDYKARVKSSLNMHMRIHTGDLPFACNICDYKASQKSNLNKHMLIHTGKMPFACNICDYKARQKSELNMHMLIHTGEFPFPCNICDYKTRQKSNLNRHMLTHSGK